MPCISVAETAAEKVISLLRRCAYKWDGYQTKGDIDPTLVRHIYDVACIAKKAPDSLLAAQNIFKQLVHSDRDEFKGQNPEFDKEPISTLKRTLINAKTNEELQRQYSQLLIPLIYDTTPSTFEQSFAAFESVALIFLASCDTA